MLPEIGMKEQSKKNPNQTTQTTKHPPTNKQAKDKHKQATLKKTREV